MVKLLSFLMILGCEYQKSPHINPREKARIDAENRKSDQDLGPNSSGSSDTVKLALMESTLRTDSILGGVILNGARLGNNAGVHLGEHCILKNRLSPIRSIFARLSQYACISRSAVDLSKSSMARVRLASMDYQIRVIRSADGISDIDICENGTFRAEISQHRVEGERVSGVFTVHGVALSEDRTAAMTGRYSAQSDSSQLSAKLGVGNARGAVSSMRLGMYRQNNVREFLTYGGMDLGFDPVKISAASKYDHAAGMGHTVFATPDQQGARRGIFDHMGQVLPDSSLTDGVFSAGAMSITSQHLSLPLELDFKAGLSRVWDCNLPNEIVVVELAESACPLQVDDSQFDCSGSQFRPSPSTIKLDFQALSARFDQLEFDIF